MFWLEMYAVLVYISGWLFGIKMIIVKKKMKRKTI